MATAHTPQGSGRAVPGDTRTDTRQGTPTRDGRRDSRHSAGGVRRGAPARAHSLTRPRPAATAQRHDLFVFIRHCTPGRRSTARGVSHRFSPRAATTARTELREASTKFTGTRQNQKRSRRACRVCGLLCAVSPHTAHGARRRRREGAVRLLSVVRDVRPANRTGPPRPRTRTTSDGRSVSSNQRVAPHDTTASLETSTWTSDLRT